MVFKKEFWLHSWFAKHNSIPNRTVRQQNNNNKTTTKTEQHMNTTPVQVTTQQHNNTNKYHQQIKKQQQQHTTRTKTTPEPEQKHDNKSVSVLSDQDRGRFLSAFIYINLFMVVSD